MKNNINCTEEELRDLWKAGQEYWKTSGTTIVFEEWLENLKNKKRDKDIGSILNELNKKQESESK